MNRKIDALFYCTTPYQIIAAVSLKLSMNITADIYITDQQASFNTVAENLKAMGIFDGVKVLPWKEMMKKYEYKDHLPRMINRFRIMSAYLTVDQVAKTSLISNTEYKMMFASSRNLIGRLIWYYFLKHERHMDFFYFDDGEGSYDNNEYLRRVSHADAFARTILFGKESTKNDYPLYLFSPGFYRLVNPGDETIEIREIPNACSNPEIQQIFNSIFLFPDDAAIKESVIFIDTMREETSMREGKDLDHTLLDSILQAITTCFGINNIIIKKHPRDTTPNQNEYTYYKYNGLPFESICMNSNISSKLIVVVRSTAAITPKLLLDQEPRVIATYKIMGDYTEKKDRLYRACKSLYRNPERFMIPENMEELAEALQKCKNAGFDKVSSHE